MKAVSDGKSLQNLVKRYGDNSPEGYAPDGAASQLSALGRSSRVLARTPKPFHKCSTPHPVLGPVLTVTQP